MTTNLQLNFTAQGVDRYFDHYPTEKKQTRIALKVRLADDADLVDVIVDTGAPWSVISPQDFKPIADKAERLRRLDGWLFIRGKAYTGSLYRVPIHLEAIIGQSLEVKATVLVPSIPPEEEWVNPNFLGLQGFLDQIRWACDPFSNWFFFAPLF